MTLPYPPPFQDLRTLAEHLCICEGTVENWVKLGYLPVPRKVGGKRLWQWKEVERHLAQQETSGTVSPDDQAERIRNATRQAAASRRD